MTDTGERVREYYRKQGREEERARILKLLPYFLAIGDTMKNLDSDLRGVLICKAIDAVNNDTITFEVLREMFDNE